MTAIEKMVLKAISGFGFLPGPDQQGLAQMVRFLTRVFGQGSDPNRSPDHRKGIELIQEAVWGLLPHVLTGGFSKAALTKKVDLIIAAAEKISPEFVQRMRAGQ